MILKQTKVKSTGKTYLSIVESYRDPVDKKNKQKTVMPLGTVEDLRSEHEDPIAWGKAEAARLTLEHEKEKSELTVKLDPEAQMEKQEPHTESGNNKNIGYFAHSFLYHQLEIDEFLDNRRRYRKFVYNANSIFKTLVFNRILYPSSKMKAWERRKIFFEDDNFELHDVYNSLDFFLEHRTALLQQLNNKVAKNYGRNNSLLYYDVTNYFFEIDENDPEEDHFGMPLESSLRHKGCSKEHRPLPIVQMGLFMDEHQIPVSYELYKGNTVDCKTFENSLDSVTEDLSLSNKIIVADKGMMTGDNLRDIILRHDGYVISCSVRKADKKFREWVTEDVGFTELYDSKTQELEFKRKSRICPRKIKVHVRDEETGELTDKTRTIQINERQIVIWSRKYFEKARHDREKVIEKAKKFEGTSSGDAKTITVGARKYIKKEPVGKEGEILLPDTYIVSLDEDLIAEEEELDGYYVICTNVVGSYDSDDPKKPSDWHPMHPDKRFRFRNDNFFELNRKVTDDDIVDMYGGLWRIEETFKVSKSVLDARPVFVSTQDHIRAHFLICFVALLLTRLLEYRLGWKHSAKSLQDSLKRATGVKIPNSNAYLFSYYDQVLEDVGANLGLDFSKQILTQKSIRSMLAETKKQ